MVADHESHNTKRREPKEAVHTAHSTKIRAIANSQEKNDANDAWWLAYLLYEGRLPEAYVATGDLRCLRISVRELRFNVDQRSDLLRRLSSHLAQAGHKQGKSWHTTQVKRKVMRELIKSLKCESAIAMKHLYRKIISVGIEIKYWLQDIKKLSGKFRGIKTIIEEIPGLGETTAATVFAELGDPKRIHSAKAYAKSTGLTPVSGQYCGSPVNHSRH